MIFIITQTILLLIILLILYLLTWFLPKDSPWSPWWATSTEVSTIIGKLAKISKKDVFYELGSGTGTTVTVIAKEFGIHAVGIESSKSRVWWSNIKAKRNGVSKDVSFVQKDFFKVDLSPASIVYLYLVPRVIEKLEQKLLKELKPGTKVISYIYPIPYLKQLKHNSKQQLFLYKIS
jgi:precorrin-6B methylase 2